MVVELFRAIPLVIMIFLIYYGLTDAKEKLWSLALGLMLYNGSVLAEVFRAGVDAVPRGQSEAAFALGLRKSQVMRTILLPQALRTMLPAIVSQLVVLLKDTALGFLIVYDELLDQGKDLFDDFQFERPVIPVVDRDRRDLHRHVLAAVVARLPARPPPAPLAEDRRHPRERGGRARGAGRHRLIDTPVRRSRKELGSGSWPAGVFGAFGLIAFIPAHLALIIEPA